MMKRRVQYSLKGKKLKSLVSCAAVGVMALAVVFGSGSFLPAGGPAVIAEAAESEGKEGDWDEIEKGEQPYMYTVNVYAGKEGYFSSTGTSHKSVTVPAGQAASIDMKDLVVNDPDQYYARGMKIAGHDNDEISTRDYRSYAWSAESGGLDRDYSFSVAYGIAGGMVKYYVDYIEVDANGNTVRNLLGREEYYGMAGDKPVVSYQYVEGYRPNAYNEGKTLTDKEDQNVFTFKYTPLTQPAATTTGTTTTTTTTTGTTGTGTTGTGGTAGTTGNTNTEGGTAGTGNTTGGETTGGNTTGGETTGGNTTGGTEGSDNTGTQNGEPPEYIDLDDPSVPLAGLDSLDANDPTEAETTAEPEEQEGLSATMKTVIIVILIAAAAAVVLALLFGKKKRNG